MKSRIRIAAALLGLLVFTGCGSREAASPSPPPTPAEAVVLPYGPVTEDTEWDFQNIMGYDGCCRESVNAGGHVYRRYFGKTGGGEVLIAETFGFPEVSSDVVRDLDGDGVTELIANVCHGDGAERVRVWRLRNGTVELGETDADGYFEAGAIYRSITERYDSAADRLIITFHTEEEPSEKVTWEWESFDRFVFRPYTGTE